MRRITTRWGIVALLETGAFAWLLSLGHRPWLRGNWSEFTSWIRITPAEDALAAFIWVAAIGCVIWLAGSTLLYLVVRASRVQTLIRSVMTLPVIRRVTEKTLGAVLVASTMAAAPVRADQPPPVVVVVTDNGSFLPPGLSAHTVTPPETPAKPDPEVPPLPASPSEALVPAGALSPAEVTVRSGDNLWIMCRRHLTNALGHRPTNEEVAPYWRQVIANNQPHLISGNPDLIYAGEIIEMPPTG
ncbi:MAG: LysM peptidoglycan-binding domain-containing protein [Acidimicrobiia bacterium]